MKILFLDIDGVLNSQPWLGKSEALNRKRRANKEVIGEWDYELSHINPTCTKRLNKIIEKTDCFIVISSTWRILHTLEEIKMLLTTKGLKFPERIIDTTEKQHALRGTQIHNWIQSWNASNPEKLISGVSIVDDDSDMANMMPWLVKTNFFKGGLTKSHADQIVEMLLEKFEPQFKLCQVDD